MRKCTEKTVSLIQTKKFVWVHFVDGDEFCVTVIEKVA